MASEVGTGAPVPSRGRIVMVAQDRQIDRRILLEADTLESAGWSVRIIGMPLDQPLAHEDPRIVRIGQAGGLQQALAKESLVLAGYAAARRRIPMNGAAMRLLKRLAWRYVVKQESFFTRLFESTVLAHPADIYVAHDLPMLPVAVRAKRKFNARLVYDSHELYTEQEFSDREKRAWAAVEAAHIGECDAVITVNASIARELEKRYHLPRVHVIYNAEHPLQHTTQARRFHTLFALPERARVLLFQGGLSAGRHIEALVRAMHQVQHPDVHLVVLGDGQLKATLSRLVDQGLRQRVHLHDAVPQSQLLDWTAAADAGVIPYQATCLNNHYCTPNKLFEFIAAGLPVLASDLPEIRRIVVGHGIGEVADLASESSIAAAIDGFFADDARLAQRKAACLQARQAVSWPTEAGKLLEIYRAMG